MERYRVTFIENEKLDENFAKFIEQFIDLSGHDSVIERKDSEDKSVWNEIYDGDTKEYLIECQMTVEEFNNLKNVWDIQVI